MKNNIILLLWVSITMLLPSCKKDFSVWKSVNENWLAENKQYIDSLETATVKEGYEKASITPSGVQYIIRHKGFGAVPKRSSVVKVTYKNNLIDGSNAGVLADTITFPMNELIEGWQDILCSGEVRQGANLKVFIPWNLAYGEDGNQTVFPKRFFIPPYSTLISDIKLIEVYNNPPQ